jgi:PilX N-terminal
VVSAMSSSFARRSRERGAALFVVLLVVTLLLGVGAFAARAAHLATAASGSERQMTQARYVAEYGLTFATAKLSNGGALSYINAMKSPTDLCFGQTALMPTPPRSCYKMFATDVQNEIGGQGFTVCDLTNGSAPGSLGMAGAECDFAVELSDLSEGFTMSGGQLGPGKLKFWYVTGTSTGQVRLINTPAGTLSATSAESSSTQTVRSRILVGPF